CKERETTSSTAVGGRTALSPLTPQTHAHGALRERAAFLRWSEARAPTLHRLIHLSTSTAARRSTRRSDAPLTRYRTRGATRRAHAPSAPEVRGGWELRRRKNRAASSSDARHSSNEVRFRRGFRGSERWARGAARRRSRRGHARAESQLPALRR